MESNGGGREMGETKPRRQKDGAPIWSRRILSLMEERHITNHELAKHIKEKPQTVSYLISGRPNGSYPTLKPEVLVKICQYFNVSSDFILGLSQATERDPRFQALCKGLGLSERAVRNLVDVGTNKSGQSLYSTDGKGAYAVGYSLEGDDSEARTISLLLEDEVLLHLLHEYMVELPVESRGVFADIIGAAILNQISSRIENIRQKYQNDNRKLLERRTDPNELCSLNVQQIGMKVEAPEGLEIRVIQNEKLYAQLWSKLEESLNGDSSTKGGACE